ncbi:dual specificity protein phosphatase family protein [Streptomyces sp. TRM66268-LWL]|uniref:Dual specificity protein phosphatase family protein n=1 Tax=Streptomyces polyasparticus TaxID=2767826 RepID=A0ABR7S7A7_9ACTN|nr:dual specificity protein phosphatase family protein [Streptomyces polyasparticus]MBC9711318.1 dual specificity protein phosphatase family protein [Streptomyces polyasparticus]
MPTRLSFSEVPSPQRRWDEIAPGLSMGGHEMRGAGGPAEPVVVRDEFEVVCSLHTVPGHGPSTGVEHHVLNIPDAALSEEQLAEVRRMAWVAHASLAAGRSVLVRCYSGYNRSGLVAAGALMLGGHKAEEAIALIRERRSPYALHNATFVHYLVNGMVGA